MLAMLVAASLGLGLSYLLRNLSRAAKLIVWGFLFIALAGAMGSLTGDPDPSAIGARNAFGVFGALFTVGLLTVKRKK